MIGLESDIPEPISARYHRSALEQVIECVEEGVYCALLGPRLCGKTVLLRYAERLLSEGWGMMCVYLDLLPMRSATLQGFFLELGQMITQRVYELSGEWLADPEKELINSATFRGFLLDSVAQLERDLVLIIEHLETVPTDLVQALLTSLRAAYMDQQTLDYRVTVVISGALSLATLTVGESSPFRGIARRVFIGDLSAEDSQGMIAEYLNEHNLLTTRQAERRLLEATRGDAFLIRSICERCIEMVEGRHLPQLGAGCVNRITGRFLRSEVFQYAPLLEAVRMIEEDPDLLHCVLLLLEQDAVRKSELPLPLSPDLDPLYLTGVVENVQGDSYRLQNLIYRSFLGQHFNPGRVGHMLTMAGQWDDALDYLEVGARAGDETARSDLLPATISSMYAAQDPTQAAHFLVRGLAAGFGAQRAQVWYAPPAENRLRMVRQLGMGNGLGRAGAEMPLTADALEARAYRQRASLRGSESEQGVRRAIPLALPGSKPIGVVTVWEQVSGGRFLEQRQRDVKLLGYLNQAARALQAVSTRRQELALAGRMQASLLPEELPSVKGWHFAVTWRPARETSGDFYDTFALPNGRVGLLVADVVDKGMGAALYMALSRTLMRTYASDYPDNPEQALEAVNARLLKDVEAGQFVTLFYAVLDPAAGVLTYCNAGHNPPVLLSSQDGEGLQRLHRTGMALGVTDDEGWEQRAIHLDPGTTLVLYTDGVVEAQDTQGEYFGDQRLATVIRANHGRPAQAVQEALLLALQAFVGDAPQFDDITLLVVTRPANG
ncbi:MAG: PP2C family protein-serine/threonine phosphatase [Chloroflexota bacterium]